MRVIDQIRLIGCPFVQLPPQHIYARDQSDGYAQCHDERPGSP